MKRKLLSIILAVISCFVFACMTACGEEEVKVTGITLSENAIALDVGDTTSLVATVFPENATDREVTWSSSEPTVVTVVDGRVSAIKEGYAAIVVTAGDEIDMCAVVVTRMTLNKDSITLEEGESETLSVVSATLTDLSSVVWESSDTAVATVEGGVVSAISEGEATVTATVGSKVAACEVSVTKKTEEEERGHVDYAGQVKLDFSSDTKKQEVTVRKFIDGDTTHFDPVKDSTLTGYNEADFELTQGYIKARYLAINTPESTGPIEEWGRAAARFTREKLESAQSIIVESDDNAWNIDSTGERYLLWVWYLPEGETEYRNLNIEILQEGLSYASNISNTRYASQANGALEQAKAEKLHIFSGEPDPDYHYGGPINTTLKELRFNPGQYDYKKIVVEGTVVANFNNTAYIEEKYYDIDGYEEGISIGIPIYCGPAPSSQLLEILSVGNKVLVVGTLIYYESGGYYQIADVKYNACNPDDEDNCRLIGEAGLSGAYTEIDPADLASTSLKVSTEVSKEDGDGGYYSENVSLSYAEALLGTSVTVKNLSVTNIYTTNSGGNSDGAMTLFCTAEDGTEITVRTEVLYDTDGTLITADSYRNRTITVKGIVEHYNGAYQIKCHRADYITVL